MPCFPSFSDHMKINKNYTFYSHTTITFLQSSFELLSMLFGLLHGLPMLADKTNFGLVPYNHANYYRFEESSSYKNLSVKRISVFLCFSSVKPQHTSTITVYNSTVTNIENTVRALHSHNSWFAIIFSSSVKILDWEVFQ